MVAISLLQPWATLAALGLKVNETRSWTTGIQGTLAIHASLGKMSKIRRLCAEDEHISAALNALGLGFDDLPRGGIVGLVRLDGVSRIIGPDAGLLLDNKMPTLNPAELSPQERAFGDYTPGRFAWAMSEARALEQLVACRGQQRLWMLPDLIRDKVYAALPQPEAQLVAV
ncbi:hypothetical protein [Hymenobacter sp. DG01]|uniref:hypothetical protein n=1 Tax=Hymenobacter sp. DG01 TaxID=2584940 RepID=UPI00111D0BEF|nr:hypothetical protein [Hymenobacter sp. DG01]